MSKKILVGEVVSDKMQKSIVVNVTRTIKHPIYQKFSKTDKKYLAHDPEEKAGIGDIVKIEESKPLSKRKRWILLEITKKSEGLDVAETDKEIKAEQEVE